MDPRVARDQFVDDFAGAVGRIVVNDQYVGLRRVLMNLPD